jgi:hypothetical protein
MSDPAFDLDALRAIPDPIDSASVRAPAVEGASWSAIAPRLGPARTRPQVRLEHALSFLFVVVWLAIVAVVAGLRPHFEVVPLLLHGAVPVALAIVAVSVALSRGKLGLGPKPAVLAILLAVWPMLFAAAVLAVPIANGGDDARSGPACGSVELFLGAVPAFVVALAFRRGIPRGAALRMGVIGLAIGLLAAATWAVHCPDASVAHVLLSHGLPALGIAAVSAAAAFRLGRIR